MTDFPQPTFVDVNGITLEVFAAGEPGRPIVLCHGFPELAYSWRHQIEPLVAAGYHVIAPNQRGAPRAIAYSVPEKITTPSKKLQAAKRMRTPLRSSRPHASNARPWYI